MFLKQFRFTIIYSVLIFGVFLWEQVFGFNVVQFGVIPRNFDRLYGIITYPLVHSGAKHLFSNLSVFVPLFIIIEITYKKKTFSVFWLNYIISGIILWFIGRANVHIGSSGVVYAISLFIITSSILKKNMRQVALVFIVIILNNGIIFGMFPIQEKVSWEGHLAGAIAGIIVAFLLKERTMDKVDNLPEYSNFSVSDEFSYKYMYKKKGD